MDLSIEKLAPAYSSGETTPAEAVEHCLARIAAEDPALGAFQTVYAEEARETAEAATRAIRAGRALGPLHGIPIALKDLIDLEGRVTTWGAKVHEARIAPATGALARRLIAAGAILIGKTRTVEVAFGGWGTNEVMGTPWNPRDRTVHRAPGGSSSGSGVAVAAGLASAAIGTDTGGSVRLPAAFCGHVGLKVTEGMLPLDGIMPLSHTLDTPGPMTRSVRDAGILYEVMRGADGTALDRALAAPSGPFADLGRGVDGLRLGLIGPEDRAATEPEVLAAYDEAVGRLRAGGAVLRVFEAPEANPVLRDRTGVIIEAEAYAHHGRRFEDPALPADPPVRARVLSGARHSAAEYLAAVLARAPALAAWEEAMAGLDALLTPTVPMLAPPVAEIDHALSPGYFTRSVNYLGLAALSTPVARGGGLPAAVQVVVRPRADWLALRIGAALAPLAPPIPV